MPAPKKALKKAAKHEPEDKKPEPKEKHRKHGKKEPKHKILKDLRRAYEHLGRVESLITQVPAAAKPDITTLIGLAQSELNAGYAKGAADLLRASEHLAFAVLVKTGAKNGELAPVVKEAVEEEFEHLSRKATERWKESDERHREVVEIYKRAMDGADRAIGKGVYRAAMELVRAAETLAHVEKHGGAKLAGGKPRLSLTA